MLKYCVDDLQSIFLLIKMMKIVMSTVILLFQCSLKTCLFEVLVKLNCAFIDPFGCRYTFTFSAV